MSVQTASKYHLTEDQQHLFNRAMWIMVGVVIGGLLFSDKEGYLTNVFTEIAGVAATFYVIDFWVRQRDARQGIEREKESLLRQVRSSENTVAKHAVHELRERGWLTGDSSLLQGADLRGANLQQAELRQANLQGAILMTVNLSQAKLESANLQQANLMVANLHRVYLVRANLHRAYLGGANLQQADLIESNLHRANLMGAFLQEARLWRANLQQAGLEDAQLQGAHLEYAKLQGANLEHADLQGVYLMSAKLQGANLRNANLQGADLKRTKFDETTVLPDAVSSDDYADDKPIYTPESYYKPGVTDMRKYTDPEHPEFWQPDWVKERGG